MLLVKIVTTLIVVSLTPFVVIRDWRYHDRRTSEHYFATHVILVLWLLGCLGSLVLVWHETYLSGQLSKKIDELVQGKNQLLDNLAAYQQDIEAKDAEINQLRQMTEIVAGFSDMAGLNPAGLPFKEGKNIRYDGPLPNALRDLYVIEDNKIHFKLGREFENQYRRIIAEHPRFPFAYLGLVESLRHRGDPGWRAYAEQAIAILRKTTLIAGHDKAHDDALRLLNGYLEKRDSEPDGAANGSQPIRSETNRKSSAAGSHR